MIRADDAARGDRDRDDEVVRASTACLRTL